MAEAPDRDGGAARDGRPGPAPDQTAAWAEADRLAAGRAGEAGRLAASGGSASTEAARLAAIHAARSEAVIEGIEGIDPDFVLHLASSTLSVVLDHFISGPGAREGRAVFAMPREEEGVAITSGLELAGRRPVMVFQDNGIGNLLTVLLTFPQPYHVPLYGVVSRRGGLGEYNSMIHTFSERVEAILDAAGVRWFQLDARTPLEAWAPEIKRAWTYSRTTHRPVFTLVNLMGG